MVTRLASPPGPWLSRISDGASIVCDSSSHVTRGLGLPKSNRQEAILEIVVKTIGARFARFRLLLESLNCLDLCPDKIVGKKRNLPTYDEKTYGYEKFRDRLLKLFSLKRRFPYCFQNLPFCFSNFVDTIDRSCTLAKREYRFFPLRGNDRLYSLFIREERLRKSVSGKRLRNN